MADHLNHRLATQESPLPVVEIPANELRHIGAISVHSEAEVMNAAHTAAEIEELVEWATAEACRTIGSAYLNPFVKQGAREAARLVARRLQSPSYKEGDSV